jgi:fucose permease
MPYFTKLEDYINLSINDKILIFSFKNYSKYARVDISVIEFCVFHAYVLFIVIVLYLTIKKCYVH